MVHCFIKAFIFRIVVHAIHVCAITIPFSFEGGGSDAPPLADSGRPILVVSDNIIVTCPYFRKVIGWRSRPYQSNSNLYELRFERKVYM